MTEDEAKMKACHAGISSAEKGGKLVLKAPQCIASACMAWRSTGSKWVSSTHTPAQVAAALKPEDVNAKCLNIGYCGLAGAPQ